MEREADGEPIGQPAQEACVVGQQPGDNQALAEQERRAPSTNRERRRLRDQRSHGAQPHERRIAGEIVEQHRPERRAVGLAGGLGEVGEDLGTEKTLAEQSGEQRPEGRAGVDIGPDHQGRPQDQPGGGRRGRDAEPCLALPRQTPGEDDREQRHRAGDGEERHLGRAGAPGQQRDHEGEAQGPAGRQQPVGERQRDHGRRQRQVAEGVAAAGHVEDHRIGADQQRRHQAIGDRGGGAALAQQRPAQPHQHQAQQPAHDVRRIRIAERMQGRCEQGIGHLRQHRRFDGGAIDGEPVIRHDAGGHQHVIVEFVDLAGGNHRRQEIQAGGDRCDDDGDSGNRRKGPNRPGRSAGDPAHGAGREHHAPQTDQDRRRRELRHGDDLDGEAGRLNAEQHGHDRTERRGQVRAQQTQQQQAESHAARERRGAEQEDHGRRVGLEGEERAHRRKAAGRSGPYQPARRASTLK